MSETQKQKTTIKLSKDIVNSLNELKIHPRQSYEEVIIKLLNQKKGEKK